jgi:hypothetical protein
MKIVSSAEARPKLDRIIVGLLGAIFLVPGTLAWAFLPRILPKFQTVSTQFSFWLALLSFPVGAALLSRISPEYHPLRVFALLFVIPAMFSLGMVKYFQGAPVPGAFVGAVLSSFAFFGLLNTFSRRKV